MGTVGEYRDRICIEDHAECYMHPAKPGHDGLHVASMPAGWGDDREVSTGRTERLRALYSRMDSWARVAEETTDADRVTEAAHKLAETWRKIEKELGL